VKVRVRVRVRVQGLGYVTWAAVASRIERPPTDTITSPTWYVAAC